MPLPFLVLIISLVIFGGVYFLNKSLSSSIKKPESLKYWGVLYFGERGSGKTLHQAEQIVKIVTYWVWLWNKFKGVRHGIILSNQLLSDVGIKEVQDILFKLKLPIPFTEVFYHFDDGEEMHFCPRKNCWRGKKKHILHGAVIVLDDIATFLPNDGWQLTPQWMRKQWTQAQHLGLHFLFNCQDPLSYDVNARRATFLCYRFDKIIGSDRPDETAKEIKHIWGFYVRRKIKAKWLWSFGNLEPEQIAAFKEAQTAQEEITKKPSPFRGIWRTTPHLITAKKSLRYDTLQDVKEYEPQGYIGSKVYECIDPLHNHIAKDDLEIAYTKFVKSEHELI